MLLAFAGIASAAPASSAGTAGKPAKVVTPTTRPAEPGVPQTRQESRVAPAAPPLPTELDLVAGDIATVPIGGGTTFAAGDARIITVEKDASALRIVALIPGRTLVYVIMPRGVHIIRVTVDRRRSAAPPKAPEVLWEEEARITTGGLVQYATIGVNYTRDRFGHSMPLMMSLRGGRGPVSYDLRSIYAPSGPGTSLLPTLPRDPGEPARLFHTLHLDAGPVTAQFGGVNADQPFDAAFAATAPSREARVSATFGNTSVLAGVRGDATPIGFLHSDRLELRLGQRIGPVEVGAGTFVSPAAQADPLPFATVAIDPSRHLHATLSYGTSYGLSTTPRHLIGATFSGTLEDCRLQLEYATRLGAAAPTSTLGGYEPVAPHQFGAQGHCSIGDVTASLTAVRQPVAYLTFGEQVRLSTQVGVPIGPTRLSLGAQYWANDDATRRTVLGSGSLLLQGATSSLTAGVTATSRGGSLWFVETLRADRRKGVLQGTVGLGATHNASRLPVTSATAGLNFLPAKALTLGANIGTGYDFALVQMMPIFTRGLVQWVPAPNYTFMAWADHQLVSANWRIQAGFQYAFGDQLPREPLLYPFRSDALVVEAFEDLDRDGIRDPQEPLLSGVPACVDATCGTTGPDGRYRVEDLKEGLHEARIDTSRLPGAMPTNESRRKIGVGRYSTSVMSVGVRYRGLFKIRTYVDQNHNGRRDKGETETIPGLGVKINAPGLTTTVVPPPGDFEVEWTEAGPWDARIDGFTLPAGYVANGGSTAKGVLEPWKTATIEVGVSVLRSIAGIVCIDSNTNDKCELTEERVGLVHVDADGQQGTADTEGRFFIPYMPPGTWTVKIPDIEVPGGLVQKFVPSVTFGATPRAEADIMIPLRRQTQAKRPSIYVVTWPKVGQAEAAELGGHFMDGSTLRVAAGNGSAPTRDDAKVLKQLAGFAKRPNTKLFITVNMDPQLPPDEAESEAHALARTLGRWFVKTHKMKPADLVTEVAMPAGRVPRMSVRVYQLRSRGR